MNFTHSVNQSNRFTILSISDPYVSSNGQEVDDC